MSNEAKLKSALRANLNWFENSGVMLPKDGLWGVAERIALKPNPTMEKIYQVMPAWREFKTHSVIEQRRPDCNFQTALLYLLAADVLKVKKYRTIAENILEFLFCRSGTLFRYPEEPSKAGAWFWSHISKGLWVDDNSWCCTLILMIAKKYPELDKKYDMKQWGLTLADSLVRVFKTNFQKTEGINTAWAGNLDYPHWGGLLCMAMAQAYKASPKPQYKTVAAKYRKYMEEKKDTFVASEVAYALIAASFGYSVFKDEKFGCLAEFFGDKLLARMDPATGNLPAEHGESPIGPHLADTIYTINWALVGFQCLYSVDRKQKYRDAFLTLLDLVVRIQDKSPGKHVKGCWRGMYDLKTKAWGGGDCYEGGASSIYTGWTNAPIAFSIAYKLAGGSLITGLR